MARLRAEDLLAVLDLVHSLADAHDPDEFLDVALVGILDLVPASVATINEVVPSADRVVGWTRPLSFVVPDGVAEDLARLADQHPLISHIATTGDGSAHRISDFWSRAEFHRSELYQLVYRPMGVEYQMAVGFPVPQPTVLGLAMSRDATDFSERDVLALNAVRPHLVQGWRTVRDHLRLQSLVEAASDVVEDTGIGVVVLSDPPEELTAGVLVTLYRYFGRPSPTSPFPHRVDRWLSEQVARLAEGPLELARPLTARLAGDRAILRYLPARGRHPGALLVTEQRAASDGMGLTALGLTQREAEVVALVAAGATNKDIANRLRIALGTVKKHLDNVYTKLGVRGRGQLAAFVYESLGATPDLGDGGPHGRTDPDPETSPRGR